MIRPLLLAVVAAVLASAGFAPVSEPILVILGLAVLFVGIVGAERWFWATLAGGLYGATFIGIVMQWMSNLAQEAIFAGQTGAADDDSGDHDKFKAIH